MKKFSCLMAFVFVILLSSTALAANWEVVDKNETNGVTITTSVRLNAALIPNNSKCLVKTGSAPSSKLPSLQTMTTTTQRLSIT